MFVMGIETSGILCGVSWVENSQILLEYRIEQPNIHTQLLADLIKEGFEKLDRLPENLDLISVASGPGSFTGLRIGMAYAKGMAYALDIPVTTVSNFEVLAQYAIDKKFPVYTIIDARRDNFFVGIFHKDKYSVDDMVFCNRKELTEIMVPKGTIVTPMISFSEIVDDDQDIIFATYSAATAAVIGGIKYSRGQQTADLDQLEPTYLRKFAGAS